PYDSDAGRAYAAAVTALMTAQAYRTSEELAAAKGPFEEFEKNRDCMLRVLHMHRDALEQIDPTLAPQEVLETAWELWDQVVAEGPNGIKNAQVTLLAPTGTIGFMMDCDTTGIEPDIALVKYKQLAGGGMMKIVNRTVPAALEKLGYTKEQSEAILAYLKEKETIEGAPGLKAEHLPVFDCAYRPKNGTRFIPYKAHIRMMAAVQPFLSGAISKTVNMPNDATVADIMQTYIEGWKLGLKALAIYRDGSKAVQPLSTSRSPAAAEQRRTAQVPPLQPYRRRMPTTRRSITHKFEIAGHEGYLTVGMYEDGSPGELFITMAKEGSTVGGMMDVFGTAISLCLQYGVPLEVLCNKFAHSHFEPSGFTKNQDIPIAKSIVDYIFRWLQLTFPGGKISPPETTPATDNGENTDVPSPAPNRVDLQFTHFSTDAPVCDRCGAITVRNGSCYRCYNCGNSMGCS
ncbi:MAG: TSCPD domain-containing protein, partial [Kiritimatiellia bacterium]